jgi:hypothetical protein
MLAHDLLNRLSVIIGSCDLVTGKIQEGSELAARLSAIREAAQSMAAELKDAIGRSEHQPEAQKAQK